MSVPPCFGAAVLAVVPDGFALEPQAAAKTTAKAAKPAKRRTDPR